MYVLLLVCLFGGGAHGEGAERTGGGEGASEEGVEAGAAQQMTLIAAAVDGRGGLAGELLLAEVAGKVEGEEVGEGIFAFGVGSNGFFGGSGAKILASCAAAHLTVTKLLLGYKFIRCRLHCCCDYRP